jgi:hypothetical protein
MNKFLFKSQKRIKDGDIIDAKIEPKEFTI